MHNFKRDRSQSCTSAPFCLLDDGVAQRVSKLIPRIGIRTAPNGLADHEGIDATQVLTATTVSPIPWSNFLVRMRLM